MSDTLTIREKPTEEQLYARLEPPAIPDIAPPAEPEVTFSTVSLKTLKDYRVVDEENPLDKFKHFEGEHTPSSTRTQSGTSTLTLL